MFHCDKCGQCCRHIGGNPLYADLDRGDGICKYLEGNLCTIYDTRPLLCRIDEAYDIYFASLMTKKEYYRLNYNACKKLKTK